MQNYIDKAESLFVEYKIPQKLAYLKYNWLSYSQKEKEKSINNINYLSTNLLIYTKKILQALNWMCSIFPAPLEVGSEVETLEKTHTLPLEVVSRYRIY